MFLWRSKIWAAMSHYLPQMFLRTFKPVLTLRANNSAHISLTSPHSLMVDRRVWAASPLVVALRCIFWFFCPVLVPSEIPKLPTDMPVRVSYYVETSPLSWLLLQDGSLYLNSMPLFLSFIFCPNSFWRDWAAFLGAQCPLPAFRSCSVEVSQHSNDLFMNLWRGSGKWSPHPIPPPSWDYPWL